MSLKYISILLIAVLALVSGCKKEDNLVGLDNDQLSFSFDSTSVISSWTEQGIPISTTKLTKNLLGNYIDPVFGWSSSEIVTQVRITDEKINFGETATADSLILYLVIKEIFGNGTSPQEIKIHEIDQDLLNDTTYYSDSKVSFLTEEVASFSYTPNSEDSILAIPLSSDLADKLLNADSIIYTSGDNFISFFKGLYLTTSKVNSDGNILAYDLEASNSKMTLYYHNSKDTLTFDYVINDKAVHFSQFSHDFTNATITFNDTLSANKYAQSMAGVCTKIEFSDLLEKFPKGEIAISKAELIIPIDQSLNNSNFSLPAKMTLRSQVTTEGEISILFDDLTENFGGNYNSEKQQYTFLITHYLRQVTKGELENLGLYLFPEDTRVSANRAILRGNEDIKLYITYTKL